MPDGRVDPVFLLMGDIILLHGEELTFKIHTYIHTYICTFKGGYADNHVYSDMWYFNITTGLWLKKSK